MRGESGEAIVGCGSVVIRDDLVGARQDGGGFKSPASPPLSAAASQVSLAPSDLTTSDPDIAGSSAYSSGPPSRPTSSSQMSLSTSDFTNSELDLVLASSVCSSAASSRPPSSSELGISDLTLPAPEDYTAETVEFPRSPLALKSEGSKESGVCFVEVDEVTGRSRCIAPGSMLLSPHNLKPDRPTSLTFGDMTERKRISVAEDILRSPVEDDGISVASAFSQRSDGEYDDTGDDDFDAPEEHVKCKMYPDMEPVPPPPEQFIPEFSAAEESAEERHWRSVVIGGVWRRIDMKVIAPYRKCVSHGGYLGESQNAVIVICACQLPDRSRRDYNYVMDNLFLYVLSTLEQLIADDYVLIYLAGGTPKSNMPSFHWLKRAYQMIDRKLRKNLKVLHVVHPTFWVRTIVALTRPFISTKFYRKLSFVSNLTELAQMVPLDQLEIPDAVKQHDENRRTILAMLGLAPSHPERTLN